MKLKNSSKLDLYPGFRRFLLQKPITAMDFAYAGVCGDDNDVEYEDREVGVERNSCITEKMAEDVGKTREHMEVLGGPQGDFLKVDLADSTGVRKVSMNDEYSDLIGVGRVFDKLKKIFGPDRGWWKQTVDSKERAASPRPTSLENQSRLFMNRPNNMLKWLVKEYKGL